MPGDREIGSVLLPPEATLRLPKPLMSMLLELGELLLVPDGSKAQFKLNQPHADRIALAVCDGDQQAAADWTATLLAEYNKYVATASTRDADDYGLFFVP